MSNIFFLTTIVWSAPPSVYKIKVPEKYGKITQRYKGGSRPARAGGDQRQTVHRAEGMAHSVINKERIDSSASNAKMHEKIIIHIQDAHLNSDAQFNIAKIICSLLPQLTRITKTEVGSQKSEDRGRKSEVGNRRAEDGSLTLRQSSGLASDLRHLTSVPFVGLEGAMGTYDLKELRDYPVQDAKEIVGLEFVKEGKLIAGELASIIAQDDFNLFGLEDPELFMEDFRAFYTVSQKCGELEHEVNVLEEQIKMLKNKVLNQELKDFDTKAGRYEKDQTVLLDFLVDLYEKIDEMEIDLIQYVNLLQFKEAFIIERSIDYQILDEEIEHLAEKLMEEDTEVPLTTNSKPLTTTSKDLKRYYKKYKDGQLSKKDIVIYLCGLAAKEGIEINVFYNTSRALKYWNKYALVNMGAFMREVLRANNEIRVLLAKTQDEKLLVDLSRRITNLKTLVSLKALKEDVKEFRENKDKYSLDKITQEVNALAQKHAVSVRLHHLPSFGKPSEGEFLRSFSEEERGGATGHDAGRLGILDEVDKFYNLADKRDGAMLDNLIKHMDEKGQEIGVMVAGGYHSEGLTRMMQEQDISYVTVTPQIDRMVEDVAFMDRVMGNVVPFDPLFTSHFQFSRFQASVKAFYDAGVITSGDEGFIEFLKDKAVVFDRLDVALMILLVVNKDGSMRTMQETENIVDEIYKKINETPELDIEIAETILADREELIKKAGNVRVMVQTVVRAHPNINAEQLVGELNNEIIEIVSDTKDIGKKFGEFLKTMDKTFYELLGVPVGEGDVITKVTVDAEEKDKSEILDKSEEEEISEDRLQEFEEELEEISMQIKRLKELLKTVGDKGDIEELLKEQEERKTEIESKIRKAKEGIAKDESDSMFWEKGAATDTNYNILSEEALDVEPPLVTISETPQTELEQQAKGETTRTTPDAKQEAITPSDAKQTQTDTDLQTRIQQGTTPGGQKLPIYTLPGEFIRDGEFPPRTVLFPDGTVLTNARLLMDSINAMNNMANSVVDMINNVKMSVVNTDILVNSPGVDIANSTDVINTLNNINAAVSDTVNALNQMNDAINGINTVIADVIGIGAVFEDITELNLKAQDIKNIVDFLGPLNNSYDNAVSALGVLASGAAESIDTVKMSGNEDILNAVNNINVDVARTQSALDLLSASFSKFSADTALNAASIAEYSTEKASSSLKTVTPSSPDANGLASSILSATSVASFASAVAYACLSRAAACSSASSGTQEALDLSKAAQEALVSSSSDAVTVAQVLAKALAASELADASNSAERMADSSKAGFDSMTGASLLSGLAMEEQALGVLIQTLTALNAEISQGTLTQFNQAGSVAQLKAFSNIFSAAGMSGIEDLNASLMSAIDEIIYQLQSLIDNKGLDLELLSEQVKIAGDTAGKMYEDREDKIKQSISGVLDKGAETLVTEQLDLLDIEGTFESLPGTLLDLYENVREGMFNQSLKQAALSRLIPLSGEQIDGIRDLIIAVDSINTDAPLGIIDPVSMNAVFDGIGQVASHLVYAKRMANDTDTQNLYELIENIIQKRNEIKIGGILFKIETDTALVKGEEVLSHKLLALAGLISRILDGHGDVVIDTVIITDLDMITIQSLKTIDMENRTLSIDATMLRDWNFMQSAASYYQTIDYSKGLMLGVMSVANMIQRDLLEFILANTIAYHSEYATEVVQGEYGDMLNSIAEGVLVLMNSKKGVSSEEVTQVLTDKLLVEKEELIELLIEDKEVTPDQKKMLRLFSGLMKKILLPKVVGKVLMEEKDIDRAFSLAMEEVLDLWRNAVKAFYVKWNALGEDEAANKEMEGLIQEVERLISLELDIGDQAKKMINMYRRITESSLYNILIESYRKEGESFEAGEDEFKKRYSFYSMQEKKFQKIIDGKNEVWVMDNALEDWEKREFKRRMAEYNIMVLTLNEYRERLQTESPSETENDFVFYMGERECPDDINVMVTILLGEKGKTDEEARARMIAVVFPEIIRLAAISEWVAQGAAEPIVVNVMELFPGLGYFPQDREEALRKIVDKIKQKALFVTAA